MKRRTADWVTITAVAMDCRDALRSRMLPLLSQVAGHVVSPDGKAAVEELRRLAALHADRLRLAIKGRGF